MGGEEFRDSGVLRRWRPPPFLQPLQRAVVILHKALHLRRPERLTGAEKLEGHVGEFFARIGIRLMEVRPDGYRNGLAASIGVRQCLACDPFEILPDWDAVLVQISKYVVERTVLKH